MLIEQYHIDARMKLLRALATEDGPLSVADRIDPEKLEALATYSIHTNGKTPPDKNQLRNTLARLERAHPENFISLENARKAIRMEEARKNDPVEVSKKTLAEMTPYEKLNHANGAALPERFNDADAGKTADESLAGMTAAQRLAWANSRPKGDKS